MASASVVGGRGAGHRLREPALDLADRAAAGHQRHPHRPDGDRAVGVGVRAAVGVAAGRPVTSDAVNVAVGSCRRRRLAGDVVARQTSRRACRPVAPGHAGTRSARRASAAASRTSTTATCTSVGHGGRTPRVDWLRIMRPAAARPRPVRPPGPDRSPRWPARRRPSSAPAARASPTSARTRQGRRAPPTRAG